MNGAPRIPGSRESSWRPSAEDRASGGGFTGSSPEGAPSRGVQYRPGEESRLRVRKPGSEPQLHTAPTPTSLLPWMGRASCFLPQEGGVAAWEGGGGSVQRPALQDQVSVSPKESSLRTLGLDQVRSAVSLDAVEEPPGPHA